MADTYAADERALTEGEGDLWMVRVCSSASEIDYVDLEVRAPTLDLAADKAETHARKHPDMYFDNNPPTYHAERNDIYRLDEDGNEMAPPEMTIEQQADGTWAVFEGGGFQKGGFKHQYQAEVWESDRRHEWMVAHGLEEAID